MTITRKKSCLPHKCELDHTKEIDKNTWAVTLIRQPTGTGILYGKHTQIFYEGCKNNGKYFKKIAHLHSTFLGGTNVRICENISPENKIVYIGKTETFLVPREQIERMDKKIHEDHRKAQKFGFNIAGKNSFTSIISKYVLNKVLHNCFTWAASKLYFFCGIDIFGANRYAKMSKIDDSEYYVRENRKDIRIATAYNANDLCRFVKEGLIEEIKRFFPHGFDVNKLVTCEHGTEGSVELFLGSYTPLSIAVSYNQLSTVRLLVEQYGANPNLLSGRKKDHTALDCAMRKWWGVRHWDKPDNEIAQYLTEKGAKLHSELQNPIVLIVQQPQAEQNQPILSHQRVARKHAHGEENEQLKKKPHLEKLACNHNLRSSTNATHNIKTRHVEGSLTNSLPRLQRMDPAPHKNCSYLVDATSSFWMRPRNPEKQNMLHQSNEEAKLTTAVHKT